MGDRSIISVDFKKQQVIGKQKIEAKPEETGKLEFFSQLLTAGVVQISFNPNHPSAQVPEKFHGQPEMAINWSRKYGVPDFEYDEVGVRGTLSFDGVNEFTSVPWEAVRRIGSPYDSTQSKTWSNQPTVNETTEEFVAIRTDQLRKLLALAAQEAQNETPRVVGPGIKARIRKAVLSGIKKILGRGTQEPHGLP